MIELERGVWIDGLDEDVCRQVESLCYVMQTCVTDALLCLGMFEQALVTSREGSSRARWERDRQLERQRREALEASEPALEGESYGDRLTRISDQARREVLRATWESGELPRAYAHRLPFIHARTFMRSLAQLGRAISALATLDTGPASAAIAAARNEFDAALPHLKPVRDSIEHGEDRIRGLDRARNKMTLAPIENRMIHAPGGGVLVGDSLNNRHYGCTVNDGSYAEVDVSDETLELARKTVQTIFEALPWRSGHRQYVPSG
jgi:hypothetical protein